jgi:hypothetical protein
MDQHSQQYPFQNQQLVPAGQQPMPDYYRQSGMQINQVLIS